MVVFDDFDVDFVSNVGVGVDDGDAAVFCCCELLFGHPSGCFDGCLCAFAFVEDYGEGWCVGDLEVVCVVDELDVVVFFPLFELLVELVEVGFFGSGLFSAVGVFFVFLDGHAKFVFFCEGDDFFDFLVVDVWDPDGCEEGLDCALL